MFSNSRSTCFNPRIRKGCDPNRLSSLRGSTVSIHASVKDATILILLPYVIQAVSIHASVKDATLLILRQLPMLPGFNPRIRKGCDCQVRDIRRTCLCFNPRIRKGCDSDGTVHILTLKVSIHASVKDATQQNVSCSHNHLCFNPRIRKGCDLDKYGVKATFFWFQSTHP